MWSEVWSNSPKIDAYPRLLQNNSLTLVNRKLNPWISSKRRERAMAAIGEARPLILY